MPPPRAYHSPQWGNWLWCSLRSLLCLCLCEWVRARAPAASLGLIAKFLCLPRALQTCKEKHRERDGKRGPPRVLCILCVLVGASATEIALASQWQDEVLKVCLDIAIWCRRQTSSPSVGGCHRIFSAHGLMLWLFLQETFYMYVPIFNSIQL